MVFGRQSRARLGCVPVLCLQGIDLMLRRTFRRRLAALGESWRHVALVPGSYCGRAVRARRRRRPCRPRFASRRPCRSSKTARTSRSSPAAPTPWSRSRSDARVTGYLHKICFKDGDEVKQGDLLFKIDPRPFKAASIRRRPGQNLPGRSDLPPCRTRPSSVVDREERDCQVRFRFDRRSGQSGRSGAGGRRSQPEGSRTQR